MAQDFFAAFGNDGVGTIGTPTTIYPGDMAGILMIGEQALEKRTAEQRKEIDALKAQNADLKAWLERLEQLLRNKPCLTALDRGQWLLNRDRCLVRGLWLSIWNLETSQTGITPKSGDVL